MAISNPVKAIGGDIVTKIFNSILWFGIALIVVIVLIGLFYYYFIYRKKFDITVKIRSQRANDSKCYYDKAAILYDKADKCKYLYLRDAKVALPVPPFNIITHTSEGDYIEYWRKSEDEFYPLTQSLIDTSLVTKDGVRVAMSDQEIVGGDINYWNVKRKEKNKGLFSLDNWFMKLLPYIPQIIGGMFMIFILYILMSYLPEVLSALVELVKEMQSLKGADITTIGLIISLI